MITCPVSSQVGLVPHAGRIRGKSHRLTLVPPGIWYRVRAWVGPSSDVCEAGPTGQPHPWDVLGPQVLFSPRLQALTPGNLATCHLCLPPPRPLPNNRSPCSFPVQEEGPQSPILHTLPPLTPPLTGQCELEGQSAFPTPCPGPSWSLKTLTPYNVN